MIDEVDYARIPKAQIKAIISLNANGDYLIFKSKISIFRMIF